MPFENKIQSFKLMYIRNRYKTKEKHFCRSACVREFCHDTSCMHSLKSLAPRAAQSCVKVTGTMAPTQKMCNGSGGGGRHLADVSAFGTFGGRVMKNCRACAAKKNVHQKKRNKKKTVARVMARAAKKRAAADASPDVLDVERSRYERRLIVREILSHEVCRRRRL